MGNKGFMELHQLRLCFLQLLYLFLSHQQYFVLVKGNNIYLPTIHSGECGGFCSYSWFFHKLGYGFSFFSRYNITVIVVSVRGCLIEMLVVVLVVLFFSVQPETTTIKTIKAINIVSEHFLIIFLFLICE